MKNLFCKFFILPIICFSTLASDEAIGPIQNSIIPLIEHYESIENLPHQKFTKRQWKEICTALEKKEEKIRIVTYNMLFDCYDDKKEEKNRWPSRLPKIVTLVGQMKADIICTQELLPNQADNIKKFLNKEFSFFPGYRVPKHNGESYGIFYRTNRFEVLSSEQINPVSILRLRDIKTNKIISIFNTHMAFLNIEKREAQAHKIVEIIRSYTKKGAVIVTGDLNTFPARLDIRNLPFYDGDYIHRILSKAGIKRAENHSLIGHFGPISTFTNNPPHTSPFQGTGTPGVVLDHIYTSDNVMVLAHAVEPGTVDGSFPSDHMPVIVDFIID